MTRTVTVLNQIQEVLRSVAQDFRPSHRLVSWFRLKPSLAWCMSIMIPPETSSSMMHDASCLFLYVGVIKRIDGRQLSQYTSFYFPVILTNPIKQRSTPWHCAVSIHLFQFSVSVLLLSMSLSLFWYCFFFFFVSVILTVDMLLWLF